MIDFEEMIRNSHNDSCDSKQKEIEELKQFLKIEIRCSKEKISLLNNLSSNLAKKLLKDEKIKLELSKMLFVLLNGFDSRGVN